MQLLFDDLQDLHGAGLDADTAGDALGCRALGLQDHDLHGAGLDALAAANTGLLVDHVHAGLGVLGDGAVLTGLHALAALDADHGLCVVALGSDLDAAQIGIKLLVESGGASLNTLQASHALFALLNSQLLHICNLLMISYFVNHEHYTTKTAKNQYTFIYIFHFAVSIC